MAYIPEDDEENLTIDQTPKPSGEVIQQAQLQQEPNIAPTPTHEVDNYATAAPPLPQPVQSSQPEESPVAPQLPQIQPPAQVPQVPQPIQQFAPQPPPMLAAAPEQPQEADPYFARQIEEPIIPHRGAVNPRVEQQIQARDQQAAEQEQRKGQIEENKRAAGVLRALKSEGVQMDTDPVTGQQSPRQDDQGRTIYKPAVLSPLEEDAPGQFVTVKRDRFGAEQRVPVKPKIDPATGEKYVTSEDGVTRQSLGIDEDFVLRRDATEAGKIASQAHAELTNVNAQEKDARAKADRITAQAAVLSLKKDQTDADRLQLKKLQEDAKTANLSATELAGQKDQLSAAAQAATAEALKRRGYVTAKIQAKVNQREDEQFQQWKSKYAPNDSGEDYDYRGAFRAGLTPDGVTGHFPDTFKLPNHPTFSDQSKYSTPQTPGGHWGQDAQGNDTFQPSAWMASDPARMDQLANYMREKEPNAKLLPPSEPIEPAVQKPEEGSDFIRGAKVAIGQLKPLAQGTVALLGATAEKITGEGGLATSVKQWGLKGYERSMKEVDGIAHENDDVTHAWNQAKNGNLGALVDWAQYGAGYLVGQAGETVGVSLLGGLVGSAVEPGGGTIAGAVGGAVGKTAAKGAIRTMIEKVVESTATKLAAENITEEAAKQGIKLTAEQLASQAAAAASTAALRKAAVKTIGSNVAILGNSLMMEAGGIYPEAVQKAKEEGRELSGAELARVWAMSLLAGGVDAVTDKLGLDVAAGRIKAGGTGRLATAVKTAAALGAVESGTEFAQTAMERVGAGQSLTDEEAKKDFINSTAMGALGGTTLGGGSAFIHGGKPSEGQPATDTRELSAALASHRSDLEGQKAVNQTDIDNPATPLDRKAELIRQNHDLDQQISKLPVIPQQTPNEQSPAANASANGPVQNNGEAAQVPEEGQKETPPAGQEVVNDAAPGVDPNSEIHALGTEKLAILNGSETPESATRLDQINTRLGELTNEPNNQTRPVVPGQEPTPAKVPGVPQEVGVQGEAPATATGAAPVDAAAHEAATSPLNGKSEPSPDQKEAGNYEMGHPKIGGLNISIENPEGSVRSGVDSNGKPWSVQMKSHYGYIRGTEGRDGDHVDTFIKPGTPDNYNGPVFVVNQTDAAGKFDEHKVILGAKNKAEAHKLYAENYTSGWKGGKDIAEMSMDEFKGWLKNGDTKKPLSQADTGKALRDVSTPTSEPSAASEAIQSVLRLAEVWDNQARKDEGGSGYAIGAENINYRWKADALRSFIRRVENGDPLDKAASDTKAEARVWIKRHNGRRLKDVNWQRWDGAVDSDIESAARTLRNSLTESDTGKAAHGTATPGAAITPQNQAWVDLGERVRHLADKLGNIGGALEEHRAAVRAAAQKLGISERDAGHALYVVLSDDPNRFENRIAPVVKESAATPDEGAAAPPKPNIPTSGNAEVIQRSKARNAPHLEAAMRAGRVPETLRAIGVQFARDFPIKRDKEGRPTAWVSVFHKPNGAVSFGGNFDALAELTSHMDDTQARDYITAGLDEEIKHAAQYIDARQEWEKSGKGKPFDAFFEEKYRGVFRAMTPDQRVRVQESYGAAKLEDWQVGAEYVRQLLQFGEKGNITEATHQAVSIMENILRVLKAAMDKIKAGADSAVARAYNSTKAILDQIKRGIAEGATKANEEVAAGVKADAEKIAKKPHLAPYEQTKEQYEAKQPAIADDRARDRHRTSVSEALRMGVMTPAEAEAMGHFRHYPDLRPGTTVEPPKTPEVQKPKTAKVPGYDLNAAAEKEMRDAFEGLDGLASSVPASSLKSSVPAASEEIEQKSIPEEKQEAFLKLARTLTKSGVDTPQKLASAVETVIGPKGRAYAEALWDAIGMVRKDLRGTHNWSEIYKKIAGTPDSPRSDVGNPPATPESKSVTPSSLSDAVEKALSNGETLTRAQLTKLAGDLSPKAADEAAEFGIVKAARALIEKGISKWSSNFDKLVDLYNRQPNLTAKTSASKINQAYSTPAPIAYLADVLADVTGGNRVYEPTAGNGMLLIGVNDLAKVAANEIDPVRAENLKQLGVTPTQEDATLITPPKFDRSVQNPPFGTVMGENGENKTFPLAGTDSTTKQIDHAIVLKSLEGMADHGRAVLIVGGKNIVDPTARADAYLTSEQAKFWNELYGKYGVIDHFTVNGDLYSKQGAGWPIDIVVISGKGKSPIQPPGAIAPRILNTWNELRHELTRTDEERKNALKPNAERDADALRDVLGGIKPAAASGGPVPGDQPPVRDGRGSSVSPEGGQREGVEGVAGNDNGPVPDRSPTDGEVQGGEEGRRDNAGPTGSKPANERTGTGDSGKPSEPGPAVGDLQVPYSPESKSPKLDTLVPVNLKTPLADALTKLKAQVGDLDDYVQTKLGYPEGTDIGKYFAGEQVDVIAAAIHQLETGGALINGDQTGIGKGRVAAAIIAYAHQAKKIPVFVTKGSNLYSAMLTDLKDIGKSELVPFFTNDDVNFTDEMGRDWKTTPKNSKSLRSLRNGLPVGANVVFTTYPQLNQPEKGFKETAAQSATRKMKKEIRPLDDRAQYISRIAPNSIFILDESHIAGGNSEIGWRFAKYLQNAAGVYYSSATFAKRPENLGIYFKTALGNIPEMTQADLVNALNNGGTALQQVVSQQLAESGQYFRRERSFAGVPFETKINETNADRDVSLADEYTRGIRAILDASKQMQDGVDQINTVIRNMSKKLGGTNAPKLESTGFAEKVHNFVSQYILATKAKSVADEAIKAIKEGIDRGEGKDKAPNLKAAALPGGAIRKEIKGNRWLGGITPGSTIDRNSNKRPHKVVIAVQNTMEGPITTLSAQGSGLNYNSLLGRSVEDLRTMRTGSFANVKEFHIGREAPEEFAGVSEKSLYAQLLVTHEGQDKDGNPIKHVEIDEKVAAELIRRSLNDVILQAEETVKGLSLGDLPLSPIDYMRNRIEAAGIKTGEITGRKTGLLPDGTTYTRKPEEYSNQGQLKAMDRFNNSDLDVIILNQSGSTGISLHASGKFKRQDPRLMIIAQPNLDINEFMQMLGRIHRSGQVELPYFMLLQSSLSAEKRAASVLGKKMKKLNANTTSNTKSAATTGLDMPDVLNDYGDQVTWQYLDENQAFLDALGQEKLNGKGGEVRPLDSLKEIFPDPGQLTAYVTGKMAVLPDEEQNEFWRVMQGRYDSLIRYLNDVGQNELDVEAMDIKAKTLKTEPFTPAGENQRTSFDAPSVVETVKAQLGKPPESAEAVLKMAAEAKAKRAPMITQLKADVSKAFNAQLEQAQKKSLTPWTQERTDALNKMLNGRYGDIYAALNQLGDPVRIDDSNGLEGYAVVSGVKFKPEAVLTPSEWIFTLTTNTAKHTLKIPASKFSDVVKATDPSEFAKNYEETAERDNTRHIVTGNLLAAYSRLAGAKARIITYTTDEGAQKTGILLPKNYSENLAAQENLGEKVVSPDMVTMALRDGGTVQTANNQVKITQGKNGLELRVPSARTKGGEFWRNPQLNIMMKGGLFTQKGSWMTGEIKYLPGVLEFLENNETTLYAKKGGGKLNAAPPAIGTEREHKERRDALVKAFNSLPEKERNVITRKLQGQDNAAIAQAEGLPSEEAVQRAHDTGIARLNKIVPTVDRAAEYSAAHDAPLPQPVLRHDDHQPRPEGYQKYVANINLERISNTDDAVKQIWAAAEAMAADIEKQRRGVITHEETQKAADQIQISLKDLQKMKPGTAVNAATIVAMRNIEQGRVQDVTAAKIRFRRENTPEAAADMVIAMRAHEVTLTALTGANAEAGRALNALKIIAKARRDLATSGDPAAVALEKIKEMLGPEEVSDEILKRLAMIPDDDQEAMMRFLRGLQTFSTAEKVRSYWMMNVLSGLPTNGRNWISNTIFGAALIPTRYTEVAIDQTLAKITGREPKRFFRDANAATVGYFQGFPEGLRKAAYIVRNGFDEADATKLEMPRMYEFKGLMKPWNYPGRLLLAADAIFKTMSMQGEIAAQAVRTAISEGLTGSAYKERVEQLINAPTEEMIAAGQKEANFATFVDQPDAILNMAYKLRNAVKIPDDVPIVGGVKPLYYVIPFLQVPYNVMKTSLTFSPLGFASLASKQQRDEHAPLIMAKALVGSAVLVGALGLAASGLLTGAAPDGDGDRDAFYRTGKKPYSIKIGDRWVSYRFWGPLAFPFVSAAAFHDAIENRKEAPNAERIMNAVAAIGQSIVDQSYFQGLANILDSVKNPERFAKGVLSQALSGFLPFSSLQRNITNSMDPTLRKPEHWYQAIYTGVPIASATLPPRLTAMGEVATRQGQTGALAFSPTAISKETDDKVEKELNRLGIFPSFAGTVLTIAKTKFKLTGDEQQMYQTLMGRSIYVAALAQTMSGDYDSLNDEQKQDRIQKAIHRARVQSTKTFKKELVNERIAQAAK